MTTKNNAQAANPQMHSMLSHKHKMHDEKGGSDSTEGM